jgi:hypothetical protein
MGEHSAIFDGWPPSFNRVVQRGLYELPECRYAREATACVVNYALSRLPQGEADRAQSGARRTSARLRRLRIEAFVVADPETAGAPDCEPNQTARHRPAGWRTRA